MQSSPRMKPAEGFSSLGSDATAVSQLTPADEAGFKIPFRANATGRDSYKSSGSADPQSAFAPIPQLAYHSSGASPAGDRLEEDASGKNETTAESDHVQFARYSEDRFKSSGPKLAPPPAARQPKTWVPLPFRRYFWIPLVVFLVVASIGLEIALYFSNKNKGFPTGQTDREIMVLHYAYTLPPVIITSVLVAMWAWTDAEIKKIQPYVDLVHGDSPPHRSLLLDYGRYNNFWVWTRAASNRHYLVALASLMVILSLSFQPLAAALLLVQDTWWQEPDITMNNVAALGLNNSTQIYDLTSFMSGAGFAGASVMYGLPPPAFVRPPYTIAQFELPTSVAKNGTAFANTTAVKTETGCVPVPVSMTRNQDGSGWTNSVTYNQCSITFQVDVSSRILFGTDTPTCADNPPAQFSPVIFWYFSYIPSARANATICFPSLSFWEVNVGVDIATGNVTKVSEIRPFSSSSQFSSFSANVTGPPLNGRAYNGIKFNLTNPDRFILARQNATQLQLPAAVYQAANQSPLGYFDSFDGVALTTLSAEIYAMYLSVIARSVYFLSDNEPITVQVKTFRMRVWLSPVAVHLLTTAMLILAFFGTIVHIFHREDRRDLRLKHEPGTIASAVSIGAQTGVGEVLAGQHAEKDLKAALKDRKFRIDPVTMKIVMEGEYGYEDARSPVFRRESVFQQFLQRPLRRNTGSPHGTGAPPSPNIQLPLTPNPQTPLRSPRTPNEEAPLRTPNLHVSGPSVRVTTSSSNLKDN